MANAMGKRYVCATCGTEMLVTRAGNGQLMCCGQPMELRGVTAQPKPAANTQEVQRA